MEDDPCWDGYEMIGTKMKKGREVPNCVPVGKGKPFTKKQLTKIILDKNKVIADLEENAYGAGFLDEEMGRSKEEVEKMNKEWEEYLVKNPMSKGEGFWDNVKTGLVKHNERKKNRVISEEDWKKQMADLKAPTEAWGADELNGDGFFDDIFKQRDKEAKENWDKKSPEEKLRAEIRQNVRVHQGQAGFFNKSRYEKLAKLEADYESNLARRIADAKEMGRPVNESAISALRASRKRATEDFAKEMAALGGAAAPTPTEPKVSPVAAAAAVLAPVREKIQNGIGDAIYGKSDDPKKQKKGLLGISEEGKEESKKKVMKNIVVPIVKTSRASTSSTRRTPGARRPCPPSPRLPTSRLRSTSMTVSSATP
jgi:hypothetical protein